MTPRSFSRFAEALRGMEAVAEHINEMQKIYEEYGSVFEDLIKQYKETHPHSRVSMLVWMDGLKER